MKIHVMRSGNAKHAPSTRQPSSLAQPLGIISGVLSDQVVCQSSSSSGNSDRDMARDGNEDWGCASGSRCGDEDSDDDDDDGASGDGGGRCVGDSSGDIDALLLNSKKRTSVPVGNSKGVTDSGCRCYGDSDRNNDSDSDSNMRGT